MAAPSDLELSNMGNSAQNWPRDGEIGKGSVPAKQSSVSRQNFENGRGVGVEDDGGEDDGDDEDDEGGSEYEMLLDPNLPVEGNGGLANGKVTEDEDSPYPEVRAAVHNYDEDVPCNTIRAWTIGLSLVVVGASMNTLFSLRSPSIGLGALIAQIIAWPLGHGWAKVMPTTHHQTLGIRWTLNPGPFNVKEHSIIVVMASVSFSVAYATDIILAQTVFYKQDFGITFQLLLTISTQSLGYGIAGIMRKFLGRLADHELESSVQLLC
jgi:hypothetical protein